MSRCRSYNTLIKNGVSGAKMRRIHDDTPADTMASGDTDCSSNATERHGYNTPVITSSTYNTKTDQLIKTRALHVISP